MPNPIEKTASQTAGAAKAVGARLKGLVGVFNTLAKEHGEVSALLMRAKSTNDPAKQQDIWQKIRVELLSHERAELAEVYPELEKYADTRDIALRHQAEAEQLETAVQRVEATSFGTDDWHQSLRSLTDLVKQHVDEEEKSFFPRAMGTLDKDIARDLDQRFRLTKDAIKAELA